MDGGSSLRRSDLTEQSKKREVDSVGVVSWRRWVPQDDRKMVHIKEMNSSPIDIKLTLITRAKLDLKGDTS